jgi:hypothetical protein
MKKTFILFAFLFSVLAVNAQNHNMRYYFYNDEYEYWILEETTNHRTNSPIMSPEGRVLHGEAVGRAHHSQPGKDIEFVKEILSPILSRYESQGLFDFAITYIVLPNGSVDEVSFNFYSFDGKLNITEADMLLWQKLSDTLKQHLRFTIPSNAPKVQFSRVWQGVILSKLLAPESPMPLQSNSINASGTSSERTKRIMNMMQFTGPDNPDSNSNPPVKKPLQ